MISFYIHLIWSEYKGNSSVEPSDKFSGYSNGESRGKADGEHYGESSNESSDSG